MIFKATTIAPAGRPQYGNYTNASSVTKKITKTVYAGDGSTEDSSKKEEKPVQENWLLFLQRDAHTYDGKLLELTSETDTVDIIGYKSTNKADVFVGIISGTSTQSGGVIIPAQPNHSISGITTGMTVQVLNNGTPNCKLQVTLTNATYEADKRAGTLYIPAHVYLDSIAGAALGDDISGWESKRDRCMGLILEYNWSINKPSASSYILDLTNENASINCDKSGNILPAAVRPTCTASLFYGTDRVTAATYSISYSPAQHVAGVSIDTNTGVFTFGSNFTFDGTPLEILVTATYNGQAVAYATMTISKAFPGADGTPATTKWINLSATEFVYNPATQEVAPNSITAIAWKQTGEDTPTTITDTIYYGYDTPTPATVYSGPITITSAIATTYSYISFALKKTGAIIYELETVPILKNGTKGDKGDKGDTGRQGAAMRGPVNWWKQTTTRRFCNGQYSSASYPEDALWIDIILKDNNYYYCNTSYNGSCNDSWATVSSAWTQADQQLQFIATNLLLANNAAIDFLTGNEIYLRNSTGTITAGAAGGNGVSFWAGSDNPNNAVFQVHADGSIVAKSGTFSGFIQCPYQAISDLYTPVGDTYTIDASHNYIILDQAGGYNMVVVLPQPSAALNGFTYNFINIPGLTKSSRYTADLIVSGNANAICKWADFTEDSTFINPAGKVMIGAGYYQLMCVNIGSTSYPQYFWLMVQATGTVRAWEYNSGSYSAINIPYAVRSYNVNEIISNVSTSSKQLIIDD